MRGYDQSFRSFEWSMYLFLIDSFDFGHAPCAAVVELVKNQVEAMTMPNRTEVAHVTALRQRAESKLRDRVTQGVNSGASLPAGDRLREIHELSVHQIELEMQNEELSEAMEDVDAARARYSNFYDLSPVGFCSLSNQGIIIEANLTLVGMFGIPRNELVGQPFIRFILEEDQRDHRLQFKQLFETGAAYAHDLRLENKNGTTSWVHIAAVVAQSGDSATVCRAVISDITELRQAHAKIQLMAGELEKQVEERTAQLEFANRELESFSASVSHDLRSPLQSISGFSEILLKAYREKLDETGKDYLSRICRGAERMGELIEDLLNLSHVVQSEMHCAVIDLSLLSREVLADLTQTHPERQVEVFVTGGMLVHADMRLIKVAVENMLRNAWKYTSKVKEPRIEVTEQVEPDGGKTFLIRDNGAGFDMAHAGRLFTAFQRLHESNDYEGTGIGLAIVQRIMQRHGGKIWAEGEPGNGATFFFTFPENVGP